MWWTRTERSRLLSLVLTLALMSGLASPPARAAESTAQEGVLELFQLLSLRLRLKRLDIQERRTLNELLARGESPTRLYREYMDRWLTRDFYRKLMSGLVYTPAASNFFVGPLSRFREGQDKWVYYLPHTLPKGSLPEGAPPCSPSERTEVTPWWARGQRITLCQASYLPDRAFDEVGYCGGQPEPTVPSPPRPGCGCGPLLLGCLPPEEEAPGMDQRLVKAMVSELTETGTEIAASGRSYDELMTTSTTWQSGLTRFLYLRRELLTMVAGRPFSRELEQKMLDKLATVDLEAPAQWVEREGIYRGSGLFLATPLMDTYVGTPRATMLVLLSQMLCVELPFNKVDSDSLLESTHGKHAGVRFEVYESPMRQRPACSGCHSPMDYGSGFLAVMRPPLFGSIHTQRQVEGRLYVNGASDFRGSGKGYSALTSLTIRQPEFPRCAVARLFTSFVGRPPRKTAEEQQLLTELTQTFERSGRRIDELVRAILLSKAQTEPFVLQP